MDNDFFRHIEQPTAQVSIGEPADSFTLSASDFEPGAFNPGPAPAPVAAPPAGPALPPVDVKFTADFIIDFFDGTQEPFFYYLNRQRKQKKYFGERAAYLEAVELSYLTDDEIREKHPDDFEAKKTLTAKLKDFNARMETVKQELPFTKSEREQLESPLKRLVEKSNFDIPPGLAMVMIVSKIMSARIIDLYAD